MINESKSRAIFVQELACSRCSYCFPCRGDGRLSAGWKPDRRRCRAVSGDDVDIGERGRSGKNAYQETQRAADSHGRTNNLAPLAAEVKAVSSHSPFEAGDCSLCHQNKDPKEPGPGHRPGNDSCLNATRDFKAVMARKFSHVAAKESCVSCHNPHNAAQSKLLVEESGALCLSCHADIKKVTTGQGQARRRHDGTEMLQLP